MRLSELIALLQDIQGSFPDGDPEVRLAMQPSWPFEYSIHSVTCLGGPEDPEDPEGEDAPVVYISEGVQLGYLPGAAKDAVW